MKFFPIIQKVKVYIGGGNFYWENAQDKFAYRWNQNQFPPVVEDKFIYFFPQFYTEKFFPDYWKQASNKDFIIIDLRMNEGGDYPISLFLDYLDKVDYKGHLILLIDSTADTGEFLLSSRMTKWQNGKEIPRKFKYTSVGQNTIGYSNFTGQWQNFRNENFYIWGIREQTNQWKTYDEGVGILPQIWAENSDDMIKTIEYLMGHQNLGRTTKAFINYVSNIESNYLIREPDALLKIKNEKEFFNKFADFVEIQSKFYNNPSANKLHLLSILYTTPYPYPNSNNQSVDDYISKLNQLYENIFLKNENVKTPGGIEVNLDILLAKEPAHNYSEKEIQKLYDSLEIKMVDIPGKNLQMMNTELTQELFEKIMGYNPSIFKNPDNPVENIYDTEIFYFCNQLSEKFGFAPVYALNGEYDATKWDKSASSCTYTQNLQANGFRLPTKDEWSFAAKGGEDYEYAGSNNLDEVAWYSENSGNKTHAVAQKKPNGYGLYDMSGNVAEFHWYTYYKKDIYNKYEPIPDGRFIGGNYSKLSDGRSNEEWCSVKPAIDGGNIRGSMHGFRIARTVPAKQLKALSKKEVQSTLNSIKKDMIEVPDMAIKVLKTEVTQKMYMSIMEENPSLNKGYDNPVENVSYYDAIYYCNKLSEIMDYTPVYSVYGKTDVTKWNYTPHRNDFIKGEISQNLDADGFRLPTLDEWNYISKNKAPKKSAEDGWFLENSDNKTHPVAQKKANSFGLFDIEGNVSEWMWYISDVDFYFSTGGLNYSLSINSESSPWRTIANQHDYIGFRLVQTDSKNKKIASNKEKDLKVKDFTLTFKEIPDKKILMLNTKVTGELYEKVMGYAPADPFYKKEKPVTYVNWYNAIYFCNKLSEMSGLTPVYSFNGKTKTSQWNYKPTDGTHDISSWDRTNQIKADVVQNPKANGFRLPTLDEWLFAAKNGSYNPNGFGLYDMLTNGREWVWDKSDPEFLRYVCSGTGENEQNDAVAEVDFIGVSFRIVCSSTAKF